MWDNHTERFVQNTAQTIAFFFAITLTSSLDVINLTQGTPAFYLYASGCLFLFISLIEALTLCVIIYYWEYMGHKGELVVRIVIGVSIVTFGIGICLIGLYAINIVHPYI